MSVIIGFSFFRKQYFQSSFGLSPPDKGPPDLTRTPFPADQNLNFRAGANIRKIFVSTNTNKPGAHYVEGGGVENRKERDKVISA